MKRRGLASWASTCIAVSALGWAVPVQANIAVDDFSTYDPAKFPTTATWPSGSPIIEEYPVASSVAGYRVQLLAPSPRLEDGPGVTPAPSMTVSWTAGRFTAASNATARIYWLMGWAKPDQTGGPLNLDITGESHLLVEYTASSDFEIKVNLGNMAAGGAATAGNEGLFPMPASANGHLLIPLTAVDDPEISLGTTLPPVNLASLDALLLEFSTPALGASISLDSVAFVPEPASATLLGLVAGVLLRRTNGVRTTKRAGAERHSVLPG